MLYGKTNIDGKLIDLKANQKVYVCEDDKINSYLIPQKTIKNIFSNLFGIKDVHYRLPLDKEFSLKSETGEVKRFKAKEIYNTYMAAKKAKNNFNKMKKRSA